MPRASPLVVVCLALACALAVAQVPPQIAGPFIMELDGVPEGTATIWSNPPYQLRINWPNAVNRSYDTTPPYGASYYSLLVENPPVMCCKTQAFGDVLGPEGVLWAGKTKVFTDSCFGKSNVEFWRGDVNLALLDSLAGWSPFWFRNALIGFQFGVPVCTYSSVGNVTINMNYQRPPQGIFVLNECVSTGYSQCPWASGFVGGDVVQAKAAFASAQAAQKEAVGVPSPLTAFTPEEASVHDDMPALHAPWTSTFTSQIAINTATYDGGYLAAYNATTYNFQSNNITYAGVTIPTQTQNEILFQEYFFLGQMVPHSCCNMTAFAAPYVNPDDANYAWKSFNRVGSGVCNSQNVVFYTGAFNFRKPLNIAWTGSQLMMGFPASFSKATGRMEPHPRKIGGVISLCPTMMLPNGQNMSGLLTFFEETVPSSTFVPFGQQFCNHNTYARCPNGIGNR